MDTLETYKVDYSFTVKKPVSPLATHILERFCKQAAIDLARQRGQEYGFVEVEDENRRATDLTKVPDQIVENLPDHNLFCERDLSHMDKLANRSAACSNRNFSGKGMRDDMTLYQSNITTIEKETKSIAKLMDEEEKVWFESQKEITKRKLAEKQAKGITSREQSVKLLDKCKTHNGPFTCVEEVKKAVDETKDDKKRKTMLRNEILFRKTICRQDHQDNPALYKVNGLTEAEMKINLGVMLSGDHGKDTDEAIEFPDEEKILSFLEVANIGDDETNVDDSAATGNAGNEVPLHEPCAVIWDEPNGRNWYIGITKSQVDDDHYMIEYLERDPADLTKGRWRYPNKEEEQCTEAVQIIPCNIIGAWDGRRRKPHFVVGNWEIIEGLFQSLYLS